MIDNLTIIHGNDSNLVKKQLNKVVDTYKNADIIYLDFEEIESGEITTQVMMPSMFADLKLLIVKNATFLKSTIGSELEAVIEELITVLPLSQNQLVLVLNAETVDKRKKIVKATKNIIECNIKDVNINKWIRDYCEQMGVTITDDALKLLLYRIGKDLNYLSNELDKLIMYVDDKKIDIGEVELTVTKQTEESIFDLIDAIFNNDKVNMINITNGLIYQKEDPVKIYSTIANQYHFILDVKHDYDLGLSAREISQTKNKHPYYIEQTLKKVKKYDERMLLYFLHTLYLVDVSVKSGAMDSEIAFKQWLINL